MAKKRSASSAPAKRRPKSAKRTSAEKIDFSDIPELTDEQLSRARRVGRPKSDNPKQLIAVRIDPKLLAKLRKLAARKKTPYQTLMHKLLEDAIERVA